MLLGDELLSSMTFDTDMTDSFCSTKKPLMEACSRGLTMRSVDYSSAGGPPPIEAAWRAAGAGRGR